VAKTSDLHIRLTGDPKSLIEAFAKSKKSLAGLEADAKAATAAVAKAAAGCAPIPAISCWRRSSNA
jgi:phage-related minor tail protein